MKNTDVSRINESIQNLVQQKWESVQKPNELTWKPHVSDPFPTHWPMKAEDHLIFYADARGIQTDNPTSFETNGSIWGQFKISPNDQEPQFESRAKQIKAGQQIGVRPLTKAEIKIIAIKPLELLLSKANPEIEKQIKSYYLLRQSTGQIPEGIQNSHSEFFQWLNQKQ